MKTMDVGAISSWNTLSYTLCAVVTGGLILNTALAIWHCVQLKSNRKIFLSHSLIISDIHHLFLGISLIILALQNTDGGILCHIGGFLSVFSSLGLLLADFILVLSMYIYIKSLFARKSENKHALLMFGIIVSFAMFIIAILILLPFTQQSDIFGKLEHLFYVCIPFIQPGNIGWKYSVFILFIYWATVVSSFLATVTAVLAIRRKIQQNLSKLKFTSQRVLSIVYPLAFTILLENFIWFGLLAALSVLLFNNTSQTESNVFPWIIAYCITAYLLLHPVLSVASDKVATNIKQKYDSQIKKANHQDTVKSENGLPAKFDTIMELERNRRHVHVSYLKAIELIGYN